MASVNKAIVLGNLGADPEVRNLTNGGAATTLSIATSSSWKDKTTGEKREKTEWHRVVMYNRLAEIAGEYLRKGRSVYIEGRLETRKWQDKDGIDRYTTEIIADQMQMVGSRDTEPATQQPDNQQPDNQQPATTSVNNLDDIPF